MKNKSEHRNKFVEDLSGADRVCTDRNTDKMCNREDRLLEIRRIILPLGKWYQANQRDLPWRRSGDPYTVWVSEIMLQQTRVETVKEYYIRFLKALPDVRALAECPDDRLMKLWEGLGYYRRVQNMQKAARQIVADYNGKFPDEVSELKKLKGIGDYTAGAIASIAFHEPSAAVDGNVLRVMTRVLEDFSDISSSGFRKEMDTELTEAMRLELGAHGGVAPGDVNQGMMDLGATICLPNGIPVCGTCPLALWCRSHKNGTETRLPVKAAKRARKVENRTILLVREGNRVLLRRRPENGLLAGMYEYPNLEGMMTGKAVLRWTGKLGLQAVYIRPLESCRHVFTHLEWHMTGYEVRVGAFPNLCSGESSVQTAGKENDAGYFLAEIEDVRRKYAVPSAFKVYTEYLQHLCLRN